MDHTSTTNSNNRKAVSETTMSSSVIQSQQQQQQQQQQSQLPQSNVIALRVIIVHAHIARALQFYSSTTVNDALQLVRDNIAEANRDAGLFSRPLTCACLFKRAFCVYLSCLLACDLLQRMPTMVCSCRT